MQTWVHTDPYNESDCKEEVPVTVRAGKSKHHSSRAGWEELHPGPETAGRQDFSPALWRSIFLCYDLQWLGSSLPTSQVIIHVT